MKGHNSPAESICVNDARALLFNVSASQGRIHKGLHRTVGPTAVLVRSQYRPPSSTAPDHWSGAFGFGYAACVEPIWKGTDGISGCSGSIRTAMARPHGRGRGGSGAERGFHHVAARWGPERPWPIGVGRPDAHVDGGPPRTWRHHRADGGLSVRRRCRLLDPGPS